MRGFVADPFGKEESFNPLLKFDTGEENEA